MLPELKSLAISTFQNTKMLRSKSCSDPPHDRLL